MIEIFTERQNNKESLVGSLILKGLLVGIFAHQVIYCIFVCPRIDFLFSSEALQKYVHMATQFLCIFGFHFLKFESPCFNIHHNDISRSIADF